MAEIMSITKHEVHEDIFQSIPTTNIAQYGRTVVGREVTNPLSHLEPTSVCSWVISSNSKDVVFSTSSLSSSGIAMSTCIMASGATGKTELFALWPSEVV
jgi:hypothetical protein